MNYASLIQEKKFSWGAQASAANFPSHGAVSIVGSILGGRRLAGSRMLAEVHAEMLLEGTRKHKKKDIQILLDDLGASLSFSAGNTRLVWNARVRKESLSKLLALVAEVLREPTFPEAELKALKTRLLAELDLEAQNTYAQAYTTLSRSIYDEQHPNWAETTSEARAALGKITRKSLVEYHARSVDASSLILSIAGEIAPKEVFALTEKYFKKLPAPRLVHKPFVAAEPSAATQSVTTIKEKASIDYLIGSATGVTSDHPDYPALIIGTNVLGNRRGFSGRLMKTVREEEGLTYGVYSYLDGFRATTDGAVLTWATFAPTLFEKGRAAVRREIEKIVSKGVTATETKRHREMYAAGYKVGLSTSGAIAKTAHELAVDNRSAAYIDKYLKKILAVTPAMVNQVLKKYLKLENLSEAAAGPIDTLTA